LIDYVLVVSADVAESIGDDFVVTSPQPSRRQVVDDVIQRPPGSRLVVGDVVIRTPSGGRKVVGDVVLERPPSSLPLLNDVATQTDFVAATGLRCTLIVNHLVIN